MAVEQTPASTSASVVRTYFAIAGGYTLAASLIWGINTLFLLDAGLDVLGVFVVNAAFTAGMVLFEIPTGVVADTLGRRISFLLSIAVLVVATLAYVLTAQAGGGVVPFAVVSVLLGLGFTFYSGAVEAWLVDALRAVGYEGALDRVFARGQQVTGVAMLVGTVGGGLLGQIDLAIPYVVRICLLVALFLLAFGRMHEIGFTPRQLAPDEVRGAMTDVARAGVTYGWHQPSIRLLMIASAIQSAFTTFVFFAWQPYLLELLDRDAVWVAGVVSAGIALAMIAGNQLVTFATSLCGRRTTLLLWAGGVLSVAGVILGATDSFAVAVIALVVVTGTLGVTMPVRQAYIHALTPSEHRATVVSFDSMVTGVGSTGGQLGLGALADAQSLGQSLVAGSLLAAFAVPVLVSTRQRHDLADRIIGATRAGAEASCAAFGTPAVSGVRPEPVDVVNPT